MIQLLLVVDFYLIIVELETTIIMRGVNLNSEINDTSSHQLVVDIHNVLDLDVGQKRGPNQSQSIRS